MANRKVLINRHTSGNTAPVAADMYKGEIAVQHKTGEEILWTKNNDNEMVPFISCAQTISIIDGKITGSEDSVVAKEGEPHIVVESAGTTAATVWQISSKDVQSEEEFKAYSANTKTRIDNNYSAITAVTDAFNGLLDITLTAGTGDDIITVLSASTGPSANTFSVTHRQALATDGFKKLTTDAYGHVTAATDVTTADIQALGFKTSAETGEDLSAVSGIVNTFSAATVSEFNSAFTAINTLSGDTEAAITAAIEALDSSISASSAGKYFTALAIEDGKLVAKEEADIPVLSVESAGTGNVVSQITVQDHKISYTTTSVATSEDIQKLSAATESFSAGTYSEFTSAFTAINNLSADTEAADGKVFTSAKTYADELIAALDSSTAVTAGKYMTGIAIADGKISGITEADLPELSKVVSGAGNVFTDIEVNDHEIVINKGLTVASDADLKALSAGTIQLSADTVAYVNQLSGYAHGEIVELSGAVQANETDIDNLSAATLNLSAVTLTGVSLNNTPLTVTDHVVSVPVADDKDDIAGATATGNVADAKAVKDYVEDILSSSVDYKGATNAVPSEPSKGDLWIASSAFTVDGKNVEVGDFIIYNGTGWDVIEKNLDGAITGTLTADTVTLGAGVNNVKSLANGSNGQVLTMVEGAPAWADDPVLSTTTTGNGNVVSEITVNDHEITYVKNFTAATNADLEIVSGIVDTFSAATVSEFNSAFTAINTLSADAHNSMIARDDAVFASAKTYADERDVVIYGSANSYADAAILAAIQDLDSVGSASTTGHYLTSVTITDGKITAVGEQEVPAATPVTTVAGTTGDTASAVLAGIATGGTDGHQLTLNATNKIFSAETSDSAITSVSAQTSVSALTSESALTAVHADAATKVDSALTIEIVDANNQTATTVFDGSSNQTITITNTDTATTEAGHYTPATAASAFTAPAGSFLSGVSVDSKNHVLAVAYADKINSATTSESADTAAVADKVANALSVSGYSSETAATLDTAVAYDGSAAQSLTFGTVGDAGLNSMTMTSAGVVDVDVIDCGTY